MENSYKVSYIKARWKSTVRHNSPSDQLNILNTNNNDYRVLNHISFSSHSSFSFLLTLDSFVSSPRLPV